MSSFLSISSKTSLQSAQTLFACHGKILSASDPKTWKVGEFIFSHLKEMGAPLNERDGAVILAFLQERQYNQLMFQFENEEFQIKFSQDKPIFTVYRPPHAKENCRGIKCILEKSEGERIITEIYERPSAILSPVAHSLFASNKIRTVRLESNGLMDIFSKNLRPVLFGPNSV